MKLRILLSIAAVYLALVGLGMIFVPLRFGIGAVPADASPELIVYLRLFGSPMLGISVLDWAARKEGPSTALNAIILGNIVGFAAIAALDVWGLFSGGRPLTKVFVVVHLFFAMAFIFVARTGVQGKAR